MIISGCTNAEQAKLLLYHTCRAVDFFQQPSMRVKKSNWFVIEVIEFSHNILGNEWRIHQQFESPSSFKVRSQAEIGLVINSFDIHFSSSTNSICIHLFSCRYAPLLIENLVSSIKSLISICAFIDRKFGWTSVKLIASLWPIERAIES